MVVARPSKVRNAKSVQDFRDAVVERWRKIHHAPPRIVSPDDEESRPAPAPEPRHGSMGFGEGFRPRGGGFGGGLGGMRRRRVFDSDEG